MAQDLTITGGNAVVPEHIARRQAGKQGNVLDLSISVPSITFAGKVWAIAIGSEKHKMTTKDADGDVVNLQTLPVVILGFNKHRGRSYFKTGFDRDNPGPPDCASDDGVVPNVAEPVSPRCKGCEMSVKGSRVTDAGKQIVACGEYRLLAVVPFKKLDMPPLRMKIAQTSDYDGQSKEAGERGFFAFSNYLGFLKQRNINFTNSIVTKMSFDPDAEYPKIFFKADKWLDEAQADAIDKIMEAGTVEALLNAGMGSPQETPQKALPGSADGNAAAKAMEVGEVQAKEKARLEAAAAAEAAAQAETKRKNEEKKAAAKAEKERIAAAKAAEANKTVPTNGAAAGIGDLGDMGGDDDDTEGATIVASKDTTAPTSTKPAVTEAQPVSDDVATLLGEWD